MPVTRSQLKRRLRSRKETISSSLPSKSERRVRLLSGRKKRSIEPNEVTLIRSLPEQNWIGGPTTLDKELYVYYDKWSYIAVYDTETYKLQSQLPVPGLGSVRDMASSRQYRCIYISDWKNRAMHRVKVETTETASVKFIKWDVDDEPCGLSVNVDHNVIVTCHDYNRVKVFTTFGELVKVIDLRDLAHPHHAIQLTPDKVVLCHGNNNHYGDDDPVQRVCIVDGNGSVLQSFGSSPGSDENHVELPARLAVVNGFIFVADLINQRVLMLGPTLHHVKTVLSKLSGYPLRMWFDEEAGRLYLCESKWDNGEWTTGHVDVYNVGIQPHLR